MKKNSFIKTITSLLSLAVVVKIIGFIKQMVIASVYGITLNTDMFFIVSELMTNIGDAIFSSLLIVVIPQYISLSNNSKEQRSFVSEIIYSFTAISIIAAIIIELFSKKISVVLAPSYNAEQLLALALNLRIVAPTIVCICITYCFQSILEAEKVFTPSKSLGLIQSVVFIVASVLFGNKYGTKALLVGYIITQIINVIYLYAFAKKYISFGISKLLSRYAKKTLVMIIPLCLGNAIADISVIIDKIIATNLGNGYVSALAYGQTLKTFVSSTIISTISSVIYIYLTDYVVKKQNDKVIALLKKTIKSIVLLLIPISIISFVLSKDIVSIVYQRGKFDNTALIITSKVLMGYSVGFIALGIRNIITKLHYAYEDTKSPMINGVICVALNIMLSIILSKKIGVIGITLATSISYMISVPLLLLSLKKHIKDFKINCSIKLIIGIIIVIFACFICVSLIDKIIVSISIIRLAIAVIITFALYSVLMFSLKIVDLNVLSKKELF